MQLELRKIVSVFHDLLVRFNPFRFRLCCARTKRRILANLTDRKSTTYQMQILTIQLRQ